MTASMQEDMILIVYNDTAMGLKYYLVREKSKMGVLANKVSNCYMNDTKTTEKQADLLEQLFGWMSSRPDRARKASVTDFGYEGRIVKVVEVGFLS